MPGKCRFQECWLEDEDWKMWLRKGSDKYSAFCAFCKKQFDIGHAGVNCIKSHAKGKKHVSFSNNLKSGKQMKIYTFTSRPNLPTSTDSISTRSATVNEPQPCSSKDAMPMTVDISKTPESSIGLPAISSPPHVGVTGFLVTESVTKAEILWASYCVLTNTTTRSGAKATDLFPIMFPDSVIASKMQLQKDKISYSVTYGLGPYCSNLVATSARKSPLYALSIDECLNDICQKQQMDIMINYWNAEEDLVSTRYLTSAFLQRSTAADLLESIVHSIADANLSLDNLVQLSTDGPNVNLKLIFDIKCHMRQSLKSEHEIIDIGTCSLHIVNGAYKTAHGKTGWNVNQFLRSLYRLFKNYPSRRAIYHQITGSQIFPKKFCSVRWTENSDVIRRCLEILSYLKTYITKIKEPPATENFVTVKKFLADPTLEAKLHFLAMIAEELEEFLTFFQKNAPLLPFLHQEVFQLMKSLASKFVKTKVMATATTASKLVKINIGDSENLQPISNINIGFGARASINNCKELDSERFKLDCKKFLVDLYNKLLDKSPLNRKAVLGASCINPTIIANKNLRANRVKVCIEAFVACSQISPSEGDLIFREYMRFCEEPSVNQKLRDFHWKRDRLDAYFAILFNESKLDIDITFKTFVQRILLCFHGNASVERSFSFNKHFLVENLHEKSLVAQRCLHDHIKSLPGKFLKIINCLCYY